MPAQWKNPQHIVGPRGPGALAAFREELKHHHLQTGERKIIGIGRTVTGVRRDGQAFPLHLSVARWRSTGEKHYTGILHDLSSRAELEC